MATVIKNEVTKMQIIPNLRTWNPGDPQKEVNHYITIVKGNDNRYYKVSSVFTTDHGYETMIFECDSTGEHIDWADLFIAQYDTEADMASDHKRLVDNFDNLHLEEDEE